MSALDVFHPVWAGDSTQYDVWDVNGSEDIRHVWPKQVSTHCPHHVFDHASWPGSLDLVDPGGFLYVLPPLADEIGVRIYVAVYVRSDADLKSASYLLCQTSLIVFRYTLVELRLFEGSTEQEDQRVLLTKVKLLQLG